MGQVIRFEGDPELLVWKHPCEELGTWTQLIVGEAQEALLYKDGRAADIFYSGRHTLETPNIPVLRELIKLPFGGASPFSAEVWFFNKADITGIPWGTSTPIQLQDPRYGIFVPVRAFGQFGVRIRQVQKFLARTKGAVYDKQGLSRYFGGLYLTKVKDAVSVFMTERQIGIAEINAHLEELSACLFQKMREVMEEHGLELLNFCVNAISVPEDDSAVMRLKAALAKKAEMDIAGSDYFSSFGGHYGPTGGNSVNAFLLCPVCGKVAEGDVRFCPQCGTPIRQRHVGSDDRKLKALRTKSVVQRAFGLTLTSFFGLLDALVISAMFTEESSSASAETSVSMLIMAYLIIFSLLLVPLAIGILLTVWGFRNRRAAVLYEPYALRLASDPMHAAVTLAYVFNDTPQRVMQNLSVMLQNGLFPHSYLDKKQQRLVMSTDTVHKKTVQCTGCGAPNAIVPGQASQCRYCGAPL